jgi:glycosyltransferase involved in cell wall biosynthesis
VSDATRSGELWIERLSGLDGCGLWVVCEGGRDAISDPSFTSRRAAAERQMAARPEVATHSAAGTPRVTFLSGRVADLIGIAPGMHQTHCSPSQLVEWTSAATRKGLVHVAETAVAPDAGVDRAAISVAIDAAWLLGSESGAQVAAIEMIRELAKRQEIARVILISDSGGVPERLRALTKVSGLSWPAALSRGTAVADILHRPYQPGIGVDYRRYHQVARCVAVTILDFIAYDNPAYHESEWAWRQYQEMFQEQVCLADCVFAISRSVGSRIEQEFAHRLAGPVRSVLLGTDHLSARSGAPAELGPELRALEDSRFLLVLGNDFEHKNRDFAVKVFADLRERGFDGRLVMAGYHLDLGSSFGRELSSAGRYAGEVIRLGSVSDGEKTWLLQEAQVVLYPTSAEGFGLVPFEAAALGTPTAFVKFGPLAETMPGVDACAAWQVRLFADHVFSLLANPGAHVAQVQAASAPLTWSAHVDHILAGYQQLMSPGAPWRTRNPQLPTWRTRVSRAADVLAYRMRNKLRRLVGQP